MQDLKVIGVENGALLAASESGDRFRIAIDEVLQSRLRQIKPEPQSGPKISPREVQAHIRSGLSAEEVSTLTGAPFAYVQRFEGPIIAEREHIVTSALGVPVHTAEDVDPIGEIDTFGSVIRERLASLGATGERWTSWKEQEGGWILKLTFTADEIEHDARWSFDPRKHALAPLNSGAHTLSQQGELQGGLIPRLRAVSPISPVDDGTRFDSGAFTFTEDEVGAAPRTETGPARTPQTGNNSIAVTAIKRADDEAPNMNQTADLLEALRKRRGEREAAGLRDTRPAPLEQPPLDGGEDGDPARSGVLGGPRVVQSAVSQAPTGPTGSIGPTTAQSGQQGRASRKGRASMPSWDEIVFGARTDDDLA